MNFEEEFTYKPKSAKTSADRGKSSETSLKKAFEKLKKESIHFDYERIPDAFSTRGALSSPRTGDFIIFYRGVTTVLEVKEVKHDYLLPAGNFSTDSRARMRRRSQAGVLCLVAVHHSTTGKWRLNGISWFDHRDKGSFSFKEQKELTFTEILKELLSCSLSSMTSTSVPSDQQVPPQAQSWPFATTSSASS